MQTLKRKHQKALFEALLKVKEGAAAFSFSSEQREDEHFAVRNVLEIPPVSDCLWV